MISTSLVRVNAQTSNDSSHALESTTKDDNFNTVIHHVIVSREDSNLLLKETVSLRNGGEEVFNASMLKGWIAPSAFDIVHNSMDCCIQFFQNGDFLYDPMVPLFPNDTYSLSLNYRLKVSKPIQVLEKKLVYDTERLLFLIEKSDEITVERLSSLDYVGVKLFGDDEYYVFDGFNLSSGDHVQIQIISQYSLIDRILDSGLFDTFTVVIPLLLVLSFLTYQNMKK